MFRSSIHIISTAVVCVGLILPMCAEESRAKTETLDPFTHLAYISATADVGTIRFESARMVQIPTRISSTSDNNYCDQLVLREPGGSMFCPETRSTASTMAYEITYSFIGQPMASDEHADPNFTFHVYFRPDELTSELRQAVSLKGRNRLDTSGYFTMNTDRQMVQRTVIDEARSHFCDGNFVDGLWTPNEAGCNNEISYKVVSMPSEFVTVKIIPTAAMISAN